MAIFGDIRFLACYSRPNRDGEEVFFFQESPTGQLARQVATENAGNGRCQIIKQKLTKDKNGLLIWHDFEEATFEPKKQLDQLTMFGQPASTANTYSV